MKKIYTVLLSVILLLQPTFSLAQSYYTIEELNEKGIPHWQQTYETKWRTIDVDIIPTIPDVAQMPVLVVTNEFFPYPDPSTLKDGWTLEKSNLSGRNYHVRAKDPFGSDTERGRQTIFPRLPYDWHTKYGQVSTMTLSAVVNECTTILETLGINPSEWYLENPYKLAIGPLVEKESKHPLPEIYSMIFKQKIHGIPVLNHISWGIPEFSSHDLQGNTWEIRFSFSNLDYFLLFCEGGIEKESLAIDIPLCDFSVIQQTLEDEINAGRLREIFHLNLGYILYNDPNISPDQVDYKNHNPVDNKIALWQVPYYAVPAWQVECIYVQSPGQEAKTYEGLDVPWLGGTEYERLIINAQTGEMIDRSNHRSGCGDYQGFISWEDVNGN